MRYAVRGVPVFMFEFDHAFVYAPAGPPALTSSQQTARHISGPWYLTYIYD